MADIFLSYAREDLGKAKTLSTALRQQGWSVFWDRTIPAGKTWREVIGAELDAARCVLVLWSPNSVKSDWVTEEAEEAKKRKVLVPAFIAEATPPLGFRHIQAADLMAWDGTRRAPVYRQLVTDINAVAGPDSVDAVEIDEPPAHAEPTAPAGGAVGDATEAEEQPPPDTDAIQPAGLTRMFWYLLVQTISVLLSNATLVLIFRRLISDVPGVWVLVSFQVVAVVASVLAGQISVRAKFRRGLHQSILGAACVLMYWAVHYFAFKLRYEEAHSIILIFLGMASVAVGITGTLTLREIRRRLRAATGLFPES